MEEAGRSPLGSGGPTGEVPPRSRVAQSMTDDPDLRAPVTIFSFFLELTRALPVQSGAMYVSYVDRDEEWSGWTDADVARLLGDIEVEASPAGSAPHTSMIARHLTEPEPAP